MRVRLQSGVILTANETIARQYLKYGAVEVIDEIPVVEDNKEVKKIKRTASKTSSIKEAVQKEVCPLGYLAFDEYQELGGKCPADIFPLQQFDVEAKMDYITFGRLSKMIEKLEKVPEDIKMIEVIIINNIYDMTDNKGLSSHEGLSSYSNGIESFSYDTSKTNDEISQEMCSTLMMQYLYSKYPQLFYRGRWVDERENNSTQPT